MDVRTRDNERLGKKRVNEVADLFESLMPKPSANFGHLYQKAWNPEDFPIVEGGAA